MRAPLDGTTQLITGASSGIGAELARLLAPRAGTLILVARRTDRLETLATELRGLKPGLTVQVESCDLADAAALGALVSRLPPVDILINNAGMGDIDLFERSDAAKTDLMMRVNMTGLVQLTRLLLPGMVERKRGGVLNISSGFGMTWMPGFSVYCGTKHFVTAFTEAVRLELSGTGVVMTQSCPGPVATEFEAVAGNPTGTKIPAFLEQSALDCARQTLGAFERGRAMITPGFWATVLIGLGRMTPRWMMRLLLARGGRFLRSKTPA
ncbi:MAG: SDR family NAD(P)-dependent oxidoreductase [Myxococcales bacterium]|nr:SDR family NAD(P)-dependent oxidoreductase [Myxococcales bacterium]